MGLVIRSLIETGRFAATDLRTVAHVVLLAVLIWVLSIGASWIPFVGFLGFVVFAFLIGGMYELANTGLRDESVSLSLPINLIRDRWLSLLGGYAIILVVGLLLGLLVGIPTIVLVLMVMVGEGSAGVGAVLLLVYAALLLFVYALFMQLIFPIIIIEDAPAIDSLPRAMELIRDAPGSMIGFTVVRVIVEYLPLVLGILIAITWAWETVIDVVEAFDAAFSTLVEDPTVEFDPVMIVVQTADTSTIVGIMLILLVMTLFGEVLRIIYTTIFVRHLTGTTDAFGGDQP